MSGYTNSGQVRSRNDDVSHPTLETSRIQILGPSGALFDVNDNTDSQVYLRDPDTGDLGGAAPVARVVVIYGMTIGNPRGTVLNYFVVPGGDMAAVEAELEAVI